MHWLQTLMALSSPPLTTKGSPWGFHEMTFTSDLWAMSTLIMQRHRFRQSQIFTLLSVLHVPKTVSSAGDHWMSAAYKLKEQKSDSSQNSKQNSTFASFQNCYLQDYRDQNMLSKTKRYKIVNLKDILKNMPLLGFTIAVIKQTKLNRFGIAVFLSILCKSRWFVGLHAEI